MMVDLPLPDGPTNPIFYPFLIFILKFLNTIAYLSGYLKFTFLNSKSPYIFLCMGSYIYLDISSSSFVSNI